MIPFNKPFIGGEEIKYIEKAIAHGNLSGDGYFTEQCSRFLQSFINCPSVLLTPSCTHALELAALLIDVQPGDEVVMSAFTFVSSANAFVLRGAKIVFVDIRPDTMNIDEMLIESAITAKTKAIVVMHYGGVACEMDEIMAIATKYNLIVIEDSAHCIDTYYKEKHLGSIGHLGALSFHSTKNIHCGEGGALLINDRQFIDRAEIIREKGTNRKSFLRNMIPKYSWVDIGSSYLQSELNSAFLYAQLNKLEFVSKRRRSIWNQYLNSFLDKELNEHFEIPKIPMNCFHNGHIFYLKCQDHEERQDLINSLITKGIYTAFHYVPLHSSKFGKVHGRFSGQDNYTSVESNRLLRLPIYPDLSQDEVQKIIDVLISEYKSILNI